MPQVSHTFLGLLSSQVKLTTPLKQRLYPMRGFKQVASADLLARGHAFIQNLRNGFSKLTATVPRQLRVMRAWSQLIPTI